MIWVVIEERCLSSHVVIVRSHFLNYLLLFFFTRLRVVVSCCRGWGGEAYVDAMIRWAFYRFYRPGYCMNECRWLTGRAKVFWMLFQILSSYVDERMCTRRLVLLYTDKARLYRGVLDIQSVRKRSSSSA